MFLFYKYIYLIKIFVSEIIIITKISQAVGVSNGSMTITTSLISCAFG
ncbi:hypothetical protein CoNPh25_CDS0016 [Staphylococcus phage S-CoN_Ph25]|nr:hypothetical protein CoNPh25_CDS0016 [Staphylococcus phage S-CoN_Ph25]